MPREKHLPPVAPKGGGKAFFVSPKTMELIKKFLGRTDVEMDAAQFEMNEKNGVRHYRLKERPQQPGKGGGGGAQTGPFCRVFQDAGAWMLTGGTVTGGTGNVTVPDIDLGDVGDEPADGTFVWLVCSGDAVTEDDVLLAGFDLATATVGSGTSLPSNTIPTALAPAGVLHVSIGSWSAGKFIPAGCGNLQISHCPGTLSYARG